MISKLGLLPGLLFFLAGCHAPGWQSLFDGKSLGRWRSTGFNRQPEARAEKGELILPAGDPMTGITWSGEFPNTDYEIQLEAQRVQGKDFFCGLTFPVNGSYASLIVGGWDGGVCGISSIDGLDASENSTMSHRTFEGGRWYKVRLQVDAGQIQAWLDEEVLVDLALTGQKIAVRPDIAQAQPLGLASYRTTAALRDIRFRKLDPPPSGTR